MQKSHLFEKIFGFFVDNNIYYVKFANRITWINYYTMLN